MKKMSWLMLALFGVAAVVLRTIQNATGFDEAGLAARGNPPALLLPVVLALAAVYFIAAARKLPAQRDVTAEAGDVFLFQNMPATLCAVGGVFLVIAGAALSIMAAAGSTLTLLLAAFAAAAALCVLYAVFTFYRGGDVQGVALLVPVCCLVMYLIVLYRADASNPVLARIYIEILAAAALTLSSLERAAFAFRTGAPRVYLPVSAMAAILALCTAAERRSMASTLLFAGCAVIELGFLCAADFEKC